MSKTERFHDILFWIGVSIVAVLCAGHVVYFVWRLL